MNRLVKVGDGRGFVVQADRHRLVITAAHCLPRFPPCHGAMDISQRTYDNLLGPLDSEPNVWAECLFADPVADIAVFGTPDNQELYDEAEAYEALTEAVPALHISDAPERCKARLLSLDQQWFRCAVQHHIDGPLWISDAAEPIVGGMSGSPILDEAGAAIGILCCSGGIGSDPHTEGGPNPRLVANLPGWLLTRLAAEEEAQR